MLQQAEQALYPTAELTLIHGFMDEQGISTQQWLMGTGLDEAHIRQSQKLVTQHQFDIIYRNIHRIGQNRIIPITGLDLGLALNLSRWGLLANALLCSLFLGQALLVANEYRVILRSRFTIASRLMNGLFQIELQRREGMVFPIDACYAHEITLASLQVQIRQILGREFHFQAIHLAYPEPKHAEQYKKVFQCEIKFSSPKSQVFILERDMMQPLPMANRLSRKHTLEVCKLEKNRIDSSLHGDLQWRIRAELSQLRPQQWNIEQMAKALHISGRSLRRKLQNEGLQFRYIKQQHQAQRAIELLEQTQDSIEHIALQCGFKDVGSFRQTFKHITLHPPSFFRVNNPFKLASGTKIK